ncbi:hypothetical protein AAFF_G00066460 [Aldrovandia affinis]|uniref:BHLH domain-containing protein n=1 Tax=Aldrovandia affinis TaxID=143900 RepID=A0AAD7T4Z0_9TELE|nr:hypothetical protein AAFF_G00066460 [Aldrovandia affinis]
MDHFSTPRQGCPKRAERADSNDQWSSESEGNGDLNEFQRKMRREHRQALATGNKACIVVERNRRYTPPLNSVHRKRITMSCSKLRQLLPQVCGARGDMVTVLEMTVAFLEHVQQATLGHLPRECLYPPDDLCRRWLSEMRQRKKLVQRQGCMEEKPDLPIRVRKRKSPANTVCRERSSGRVPRPVPLNMSTGLSPTSVPHTPLKFCAPSFWCSPALSPVTQGHPRPAATWNYCSTAKDRGLRTNLPEEVEDTPLLLDAPLCVSEY